MMTQRAWTRSRYSLGSKFSSGVDARIASLRQRGTGGRPPSGGSHLSRSRESPPPSRKQQRGKFSPAEAVAVLDPIMGVLNSAHAMGVVHRDLKPENIMIGKPGSGGEPVVKLLDLGIAKLREVAGAEKTGNTALTIAGQMLGTPYYMSPEQWGELPDDGNSEIDGRADIYSLGVVFYEVIAGRRPFSGVTLSELRRQHVSITPPTLHEVDASVPEEFSHAIARAIAKDRSHRQATAGDLENELRSALATAGIAPAAYAAASQSESAAKDFDPNAPKGPLTAAERTAATIASLQSFHFVPSPHEPLSDADS